MIKYYSAQVTLFGPPALIIVGAYDINTPYPKSEGLLLLPGEARSIGYKLKFSREKFDEVGIELSLATMLDEAVAPLRIDLGTHIERLHSKTLPPPGVGILTETTSSALGAWRLSKLPLEDAHLRSDMGALVSLLDRVRKMPPVTITRLTRSDEGIEVPD